MDALPLRVQQSRARGWRKPPNTVGVARPSRWGNPFRVGTSDPSVDADEAFGRSAAEAVSLYRKFIAGRPDLVAAAREQLAGRNLMCFCPLGQPCHADVLLDVANRPQDPTSASVLRAHWIE